MSERADVSGVCVSVSVSLSCPSKLKRVDKKLLSQAKFLRKNWPIYWYSDAECRWIFPHLLRFRSHSPSAQRQSYCKLHFIRIQPFFYFIFATKRLSAAVVVVLHVAKEICALLFGECCASRAHERSAHTHTHGSDNRKFTFKMIFVLHINVFVDATRYTPKERRMDENGKIPSASYSLLCARNFSFIRNSNGVPLVWCYAFDHGDFFCHVDYAMIVSSDRVGRGK